MFSSSILRLKICRGADAILGFACRTVKKTEFISKIKMNEIKILDQNTIDKIAAGEVVERPASVAKELIENAIDSGANAITVEIKNGGIDFIRITDNGCGIPADQIRTAFLRHATSKLRTISDLSSVSSLGFRGEALSSICAVSQVELITRDEDSVTGVRYVIHGGKEISFEEVGAPFGTTIIMRNLFFNTPARAKFLKSPTSEQNAITAYVEQLALSHPDISFKYIAGSGTRLYTSGNGSLKEAVYQIYGKETVRSLIPIEVTGENLRVSGFLGRAEAAKGNRNFEIYFVNGRYVRDKIISKAIEDGYQGNLMQHRYPFTVLNIETDRDKVDVNVHPAKLEVRFSRQQEIYDELSEIVRVNLLERQSVPEVLSESRGQRAENRGQIPDKSIPEPFEVRRRDAEQNAVSNPLEAKEREIVKDTVIEPLEDQKEKHINKSVSEQFEIKRREAVTRTHEIVAEKQVSLFEDDKFTAQRKQSYRIIGQVFDTYFLIESEDKLYIIDQHAAHEKVIYERLMKSLSGHKNISQLLMPSVVLSLSPREAEILNANMDSFEAFGFKIEEFGGREFRITEVPADLYDIDTHELFTEILADLDEPSAKEPKIIGERIALKSCKAAIKGNMRMSQLEIRALIDELFTLEDPYHCPHGRPVIISFSHYELDRKFKRIV